MDIHPYSNKQFIDTIIYWLITNLFGKLVFNRIEQMKNSPFCSNNSSTTILSSQNVSFHKEDAKTNRNRDMELLQEKVRELQCMLAAAIRDQNELKNKQNKLLLTLQERREKLKLRVDQEASPGNEWYRTLRRKSYFEEQLNGTNEFSEDLCNHLRKHQIQFSNLNSVQSSSAAQTPERHSSPERLEDRSSLNSHQTSRFCPASPKFNNYPTKTKRQSRGTSAFKSNINVFYPANFPSNVTSTIEQIWQEVRPSKTKFIQPTGQIKIRSFLQ